MRMFDSFLTCVVITVLSFGVAFVNLFLIYAIWKHSPNSMGHFKKYMMAMSVADFVFASSIAFLFLPNLMFPLPVGTVMGLLKYLGPIGGPIAYSISIVAGGWMMMSIWQCCLYRMYVFYHLDKLLEIANDYFALFEILQVFVIAAVIAMSTRTNAASYEDLLDYAKRHGHKVPADLTPETSFMAFDLDRTSVRGGVIMIGAFLFVLGIWIGALNIAVQKKIRKARKSMSSETYRMQKSLTVILLAQVKYPPAKENTIQAIIPGISIAIPVLVYCTAIFFSLTELFQSTIVEWFSVLIIGAYPFVNSCFCLYYMKPYRKFTIRVLRKIIWCWNLDTVVVELTATEISASPTSGKT